MRWWLQGGLFCWLWLRCLWSIAPSPLCQVAVECKGTTYPLVSPCPPAQMQESDRRCQTPASCCWPSSWILAALALLGLWAGPIHCDLSAPSAILKGQFWEQYLGKECYGDTALVYWRIPLRATILQNLKQIRLMDVKLQPIVISLKDWVKQQALSLLDLETGTFKWK